MSYADAEPFPHVVLDGLFPDDLIDAAAAEFPPPGPGWQHLDSELERKFASNDPTMMGPATVDLLDRLTSPDFCRVLTDLTDIPDLLPSLHGGGMHQIARGGLLKVHADFNRHEGLYRRLNVLLFLNRDWQPEWGGHLELWDDEGPVERILPVANRLVVFTTSDTSYHGHPHPLACPEGETRKSLAVYMFTEAAPEGYSEPHSTVFVDS